MMRFARVLVPVGILVTTAAFVAACASEAAPTPTEADPTPTETGPTPVDAGAPVDASTIDSGGGELPRIELTGDVGGAPGDTAPEFTGIDNWINSNPLTMEELRGQVVLIDFWTYTCINCIRTIPYLRDWQAKYADQGLTIVGVHTPEFEFEKVTENVIASTEELGVDWAVAQDNDFGTWREYNNRFWPAKYLIDANGVVRYTHFGEGAYNETEDQIRELLMEAGTDVSSVASNPDPGPVPDQRAYGTSPRDQQTREIYGGFSRNSSGFYIAHPHYYEGGPEYTQFYRDPEDHINQFIYLEGQWTSDFESIRHGRATEDLEDYIALLFFARTVNIVIDFEEGAEPFEVEVTIADIPEEGADSGAELAYRPLTTEEAGEHIVIEDGRSYFVVDEADLYNVVALPEFGSAELKFSSNSPDFALFALTFGSYLDTI